MKVLLVSANTLTEPYPVYPLGLDYVAAAIDHAHEVQIADMNVLKGYEPLIEMIGRFSPDIIGLSLRNIDNTDTTDPRGFMGIYAELIGVLRRHCRALIVLGGSGLTLFPLEAMAALKADYGVVGEGERFALLLEALENQKDAGAIPGIITPGSRKPIPAPWDKKLVRNFQQGYSHLSYYLKHGGILNLQTKRGCSFQCIYCTYPHIEGRRHRLIAPAEIAASAVSLQEAGAKYLFITDAVFNSDFSHNIRVARAFKKAGLSIPWGAFFAPLQPPDDYFQIMADAGLTHVEFGTESLSNHTLASYRKPYQVQHVFNAHRAAIAAGLHVAHYFLLGGPGENTDTLNETLSGIDDLNRAALFFFCGMRIYPYTALYDIAVKEGQVSKNQNLLEPVFYRSALPPDTIAGRVKERSRGRPNWIIGSGGSQTAGIIARLYGRGHSGPLWEYLIR
ncbi:MAG: lipid biosynthesis B12-binding/radical SAM protein [Desulfobacterales bacterium]|nr:lipid biosynthesis B12-binding/radical SAM protein [Desulfobacterales bacterium]